MQRGLNPPVPPQRGRLPWLGWSRELQGLAQYQRRGLSSAGLAGAQQSRGEQGTTEGGQGKEEGGNGR